MDNAPWSALLLHRDTAGQERYKSLAPMYYRNANCAVVVYDITQPVSKKRPLSKSLCARVPCFLFPL